MKKTLKGLLALCMTMGISIACSAAEITMYDECVKVSGKVKDGVSGETVTVIVLEDGSADGFENTENIAFYGESKLAEDKTYSLIFSLKNSGKYYCYVGIRGKDTAEKTEFSYISKSLYDEILSQDNKETLAEFIWKNAEQIGLDEIDEEKAQEISELLFDEIKEEQDISGFLEIVEKAELITKLNNGEISDIKECYDSLGLDDTDKKYFREELSKELTEKVSEKEIKSIKEFEKLLIGEIIVIEINEASKTRIELILDDYKELFPDNEEDGLAQTIKEKAPFGSFDELYRVVENYEEKSNTSSSGGGNTGGKGSNKNQYTGSVMVTVPQQEKADKTGVFSDIDSVPWAKEHIENMYFSGIISGKEEGRFFPNDKVTREEFAKMVTLAFKMNLIDDEFPFTDVLESDWSYTYVKTAYLAGVTNGIGNNLFGKTDKITRQDLCTMVYRAVQAGAYNLPENTSVNIKDENEIAYYAKEAVEKMVRAGIISGDENQNFNPRIYATRAEAAKIINLTISSIK